MQKFVFDLKSGKKLRKYRQALALQSNEKKLDSTLTLKFKLQPLDNLTLPSFSSITPLYDTLEGISKGSLSYFLFSVVNAGFRIFDSNSKASAFAAKACYQDDFFYENFKELSGLDLPDFVPSKIAIRLKKEVRAARGKDNRFVPEVIISEYKREIGKLANKTPEAENKVDELFTDIAEKLCHNFTSWNDLKKDPAAALHTIDEILVKKYDLSISLAKLETKSSELLNGFPKNSSIAFDSDAMFIQSNEELNHYFAVATILNQGRKDGISEINSKYIQKQLTTTSYSGLSWLFGDGLKYLKETSIDKICAAFLIPESKTAAVAQIKDAASLVKVSPVIDLSLQKFRTSLGGKLDSWVSNYYSRLDELNSLLGDLPKNITIPDAFLTDNEDFLYYSGCSRQEITSMLRIITDPDSRERLQLSLNALLGKSDTNICAEDVTRVKDYSDLVNSLYAFKNQIDNSLEQAEKDLSSPFVDLKIKSKKQWDEWTKLKKIPKLNALSGGVPNVNENLQKVQGDFLRLYAAQQEHYNNIIKWASANNVLDDYFLTVQKDQAAILAKRNHSKEYQIDELAFRVLLNKTGRIVRKSNSIISNEIIKWFETNKIFKLKKHLNKFFYNKLGTLYKHPFSNSKNNPYDLNENTQGKYKALLDNLEETIESLFKIPNIQDNLTALKDLIELRSLWYSIHINSLTDSIPSSLAKPLLGDELYNSSLSASLKFRLTQKSVEKSVLNSIFNSYKSLLSGFITTLSREHFYLRCKFTWIDNNDIYYSPKIKPWKIPESYFKSEIWNTLKDQSVLVVDEGFNVDVAKTFENACYTLKQGADELAALIPHLLMQLPHDWLFALPFATENSKTYDVINYSKTNKTKTFLIPKSIKNQGFAKLSGPSSYYNQLDEIILNPKKLSIGDMNLLVDEPNEQAFTSGQISVHADPYILSIAVPIKRVIDNEEKEQAANSKSSFDRIVAIDQGEAGFAYAVFNLSDLGDSGAEPIAQGVIPIPSIHRLIHKVKGYRSKSQRSQKFNQRFDSTMFTLRENVAGDVCGLIVALMKRFNAFPVLEYQVKNLSSGSKQLQLVYKQVNAKFLYSSDNKMQNDERSNWWYKGNSWDTGILTLSHYQDGSNKNDIKINGKYYRPLILNPGASVNAYMTSRICHVCNNNPIELLRNDFENGNKLYHINQNGEVTIKDKTLKLYKEAGRKTPVPNLKEKNGKKRTYASLNERAPWTVPVDEQDITGTDLEKLIKNNMRRAPKSYRSKDTSQSRYFCVFKDCSCHNKEQHADINAAINIGRRFLAESIWAPK